MNEFGCRWREFRLLSHTDVVTVTMTDLAAPHHHVTDAAVLPDGTHCAHPYIFFSLHMYVNKTSTLWVYTVAFIMVNFIISSSGGAGLQKGEGMTAFCIHFNLVKTALLVCLSYRNICVFYCTWTAPHHGEIAIAARAPGATAAGPERDATAPNPQVIKGEISVLWWCNHNNRQLRMGKNMGH